MADHSPQETENESCLTPAQRSALAVVRAKGSARLGMHTNPLTGTIAARSAYSLVDKGLLRTWARRDGVEAVLPDSERDRDADDIARTLPPVSEGASDA